MPKKPLTWIRDQKEFSKPAIKIKYFLLLDVNMEMWAI